MIPKIIHYCWFGRNPLPPLAQKCIESWKKYFPEYEIKEWNEDNFDVNIIPYTAEAYAAKKYAFVSDFVRFYVLYEYGGLYFDTDVEVIKPMEDIISRGPFMGRENSYEKSKELKKIGVNPGLGIGATPNMQLYDRMISIYRNEHFIIKGSKKPPKTVVDYTTELLEKEGLHNTSSVVEKCGIWIYPSEYFCPLDYFSGKLIITDKTHTIHHYSASWKSISERLFYWLARIFGLKFAKEIAILYKKIC